MASGSSVHKVNLQISNMDTHYYEQHTLTIAQHPSETDQRLMVRILAFVLFADEKLEFGKGLSDQDEPALWIKDMAGEVDLWIEIGLVDESRIRKACFRSKKVVLILYGSKADSWWKKNQKKFTNKSNLTVIGLSYEETHPMSDMAIRNIDLTCNIEDRQVVLIGEHSTAEIKPAILYDPEKKIFPR